MASPSNILVSPSTTLVQVDSLQIPYTPVILQGIAYTGQTVSIQDYTSSIAFLTNPIVVSTNANTLFANGLSSTFINQPQGYITVQSLSSSSNTWNILNSFPFRDETLSAGLYFLNTSSLFTATLSSVQEVISTLTVNNLSVTKTFVQTGDLVLSSDLSSFGAVSFLSSVTIGENTFFSSKLSTIGFADFRGFISTNASFTSISSITTLSSVYISGAVLCEGGLTIATSNFRLGDGLQTTDIEILSLEATAADVAGTFESKGPIVALSTLTLGGGIETTNLIVGGNLSTAQRLAVFSTLTVNNSFSTFGFVSSVGPVAIGTSASVSDTLVAESETRIGQSLSIGTNLLVGGYLSSFTLSSFSMSVGQDLCVLSTASTVLGRLVVEDAVGTGTFVSYSSFIGRYGSTLGDFVAVVDLSANAIQTPGSISTLRLISPSLSIHGGLSTLQTATISSVILGGSLFVRSSFQTNTNSSISTGIRQDIVVYSTIFVGGITTLESFPTPDSLVASSMTTSSFYSAFIGRTQGLVASTLYTSSAIVNGTLDSNTFAVYGGLSTSLLSSFYVSSQKLILQDSEKDFTNFRTVDSFTVGEQAAPAPSIFSVADSLHVSSTLYIGKELSSFAVAATKLTGAFFGDGSDLSNCKIGSILAVSTTTIDTLTTAFHVSTASTVASTLFIKDSFFANSSIVFSSFTIFGNAASLPIVSTNFLTNTASADSLEMNNMTFVRGPLTSNLNYAVINSNLFSGTSNRYALWVGDTMRLTTLNSPQFILPVTNLHTSSLQANQIQNLPNLRPPLVFVSSGQIRPSSGTFLVGDAETILQVSSPILQPSLSTLCFNSTLFVKTNGIGINTQPNFTVDVPGTTQINSFFITQSTLITSQLDTTQRGGSLWYGVGAPSLGVYSNIRFSSDGETWNPVIATGLPQVYSNIYYAVAFRNDPTEGLQWLVGGSNTFGNDTTIVAIESSVFKSSFFGDTVVPNFTVRGIGHYAFWVATGSTGNGGPTGTILVSFNGRRWTFVVNGGFSGLDAASGGFDVAFNGRQWVAVGIGASATNSIQVSSDGLSWRDATSGGFANGIFGITWAETRWIATGNGGTNVSFLTSSDGFVWTTRTGGFSVKGNSIAFDGYTVVAVGQDANSQRTIQYSTDYGITWNYALGTLFASIGYTVKWNGSYWLAGGEDGIRKSFDGIRWYQPSSAPTYPFYGVGWSSNQWPTAFVLDPYTEISTTPPQRGLGFYTNQANLSVSTNTIVYTPSSFVLNNTLRLDSFGNVVLGTVSPTQLYRSSIQSTFYQQGSAVVSAFISSLVVQTGGYYLGIQSV
jgi:hypothetical protein